jgi:hypothetical protein
MLKNGTAAQHVRTVWSKITDDEDFFIDIFVLRLITTPILQ